MIWKAPGRDGGSARDLQLWEMSLNHVENTLRFLNAQAAEVQGNIDAHQERGLVSVQYRIAELEWTLRRLRLYAAFMDRELRYRANREYNAFRVRITRIEPNDNTTKLVFADWLEERGYHVMARKLRCLALTGSIPKVHRHRVRRSLVLAVDRRTGVPRAFMRRVTA